jgi:phosphoglycolate phosphatase
MPAPVRLAVFDVDGTLIDSQHNIVAAMEMAFRAVGLVVPDPADVRRIIGLSLPEAVAALLLGQDPSLHVAVVAAYRDAFFTLRNDLDYSEPLFSGVLGALAELDRQGWLLGIATGKSRRGLDAMIERHGLDRRFVTCQSADGNPGKPHPGMVLRAMDEAGADPNDTVMIGDTTFDMQMGRAARAKAAGVTWGYHPAADLRAAGAQTLIAERADIPSDIAALLENG